MRKAAASLITLLIHFVVVDFVAMMVVRVPASAAIRKETVEYRQGNAVLEGVVAYDDARKGPRPGVLVIHEWKGLNDYARKRAEQLAEMGFVAFAADIFGKGVRPKEDSEAAKVAGKYKSDRKLLRARAKAGLDILAANPRVEPSKLAAIGYCFGGTAALELARSGAPLAGTISFHGHLDTPDPADAKNIKGKVLVLHGADDPSVPPKQVSDFQEEMRKAGIDWRMTSYGGAVHAFTVPSAGNDPAKGAAYDKRADERSFEEMKDFFREIF